MLIPGRFITYWALFPALLGVALCNDAHAGLFSASLVEFAGGSGFEYASNSGEINAFV